MQVGNKCPGLNEYHTFESGFCLKECEHQCVPASVLVHIQHRQKVDKHQGLYLSVTSLLGCLRQLYFERTLDYFVEPPKNWWSLRGSMLHRLLENPGIENLVDDFRKEVRRLSKDSDIHPAVVAEKAKDIEERIRALADILPKTEIPNWQSETEYQYETGIWFCKGCKEVFQGTFSCPGCGHADGVQIILFGTIDVLRPDTGELYDYKTIGDRGLALIKEGAKDDHITQFNLYRLLVEKGHPTGIPADQYTPIEIKKIVAFYMTMMQVVRTGGLMAEDTIWRVSEPEPHPNQVGNPEILGEKEELKLKRGKRKENAQPEDYDLSVKRKYRINYAIPEVPLVPIEKMQEFIRDTVPILVRAFHNGEVPPMCPPEMRQWKCTNYCPDQIRAACDKHNELTGEKREVEVNTNAEIPCEVM